MHDLVIRGGRVVDGSGRLGRTADVAIDGARVVAVGSLMPHGALRAYVLGEGRANDAATPEEIATMAALVREAAAAGAVGVSTTRTVLHRAKDGELAAGTTAAAEELIGIGEA